MYYSPNYHLVEIDENSYMKTPSGLYYAEEGNEYDKYIMKAKMVKPLNDKYKVGQELFVSHFVIDNSATVNGKKLRFVQDEEVLIYFENEKPKSNNYILATKSFKTEKFLEYETKKEIDGQFKVLYSDFKGVKKENDISIYIDTDYPIKWENLICIKPTTVLKNLTTNKPLNDYIEVEPLDSDNYEQMKGGVFLKSSIVNKNLGLYNGLKVIAKFNPSTRLDNGNYMVKKDDLQAYV